MTLIQICLISKNVQTSFEFLKTSSHTRKFFVSSYENSVCSFILFLTKKFVHVTTLTKYVLKGLRTFTCSYEELLTNKKFHSQGIVRKTWKKKSIEFATMTRCTNNVNIYKMQNVFKIDVNHERQTKNGFLK